MKRHAWLVGGLSLALGLTACSGSESDEVTDLDAGADIRQLRDDVDMLTPKPGEFGTRLDMLEAPKVDGLCSAGELCIPDGIDLAKVGFQPIIAALCAKAASCCEVRELTWLYGNAVKSAADCEATFTDLINNGQSNSYTGVFGGNLENIVRAAHALNDTSVRVALDDTAVASCAAEIGAEVCDADRTDDGYCSSNDSEYGACSLFTLLKGKERAGDTCDPTYFNECGPGLVCRGESYSEAAQSGLCTAKAEVGGRCTKQSDCDDLICDVATGTCKAGAQLGEHCEYRDPTFVAVGPIDGNGQYSAAVTSIDCARGLTCNPITNICVTQYCAQGSYCRYHDECPNGTVCTSAGSEALAAYSSSPSHIFIGLCTPGLPDGAVCVSNERGCASFRCFDHDGDDTETCQPSLDGCDYDCAGHECDRCPSGFFCDDDEVQGTYCVALLANGESCGSSTHASCLSGFCNEGTCEAKVLSGGSCSGYHEQCPAGEYCSDGTCTTGVAVGAACSSPGDQSNCAAGLSCWDANDAGDYRCYQRNYEGGSVKELPDGVYCVNSDDLCASGWCRRNIAIHVCTAPLPAGAECNPDTEFTDRCVDGFACVPNDASSLGGTCTKFKLPGEPCDPGLNECGGSYYGCELHNEAFLCGADTGVEPFCVQTGTDE